MKYMILLSLLLTACIDASAQLNNPVCKPFKMYHDIKWSGMPNVPMELVIDLAKNDKQAYWKKDGNRNIDFPDENTTRSLALTIPVGKKVYFNIEHLPTRQGYATEIELAESMQKLSNIAYWVKSERPSINIGFYTILPQRELTAGYWTPEWRARNDYYKPLASYVDIIYPSLYTFYNDQQGWVDYAKANVREARKYGKPVIAFIWPQYHASSPTNPNELISGDYWRLQLETLYLISDGVVIWTGGCCAWADMASDTDPNNWWYQTLDFIKSKGL